MSEACNHDCGSCASKCEDDTTKQQSFLEKPNELSSIKHVIAVVSGKGGVGKSLVTSMLAVSMARHGYHTGVLDADITGPSIPKVFGVKGEVRGSSAGAYPVKTAGGIDIMSINLLLENDTDPVVWRGPVISGAVKQFWTDVIWGDIDYMFVDMPPGTGDVPLTVFQSLPMDGILVVTSPQELVSMIVEKALNMSEMMHVPVLGLIENMSYFECPHCHEKLSIFGKSHVEESAQKYDIPHTAKLPIDPEFAAHCDKGDIEGYEASYMADTASFLEGVLGK